jgi:hypothetical protein
MQTHQSHPSSPRKAQSEAQEQKQRQEEERELQKQRTTNATTWPSAYNHSASFGMKDLPVGCTDNWPLVGFLASQSGLRMADGSRFGGL